MAGRRTRNFATVVYPDSAPSNWIAILSDTHIPAFISPIHDRDTIGDIPGGELKKSHYHVMLMFDSVKTQEQAREIFDQIGGVGLESVNSISSYARYLCHLDDPGKARYDIEDVLAFGGADYIETISLPGDKYDLIGDMMDFVDDADIVSLAQLLRFSKENKPDWFRVLCNSAAFVMREYIKSRFWSNKQIASEEGLDEDD